MLIKNEKYAEECTKLANKAFGLEMLCEHLLSDMNCSDEDIKKIIKLAKNREFKRCCEMIEDLRSSYEFNLLIFDLIKKLGIKRSDLAKSANISQAQLNNYVSEGREVLELANGDYVLVTSKTKIFKVSNIK